jgi:hypothetical protein
LWYRLRSLFQAGANLDTMRNNVPSSPAFGPYGNNLPGSNYDDPKPVNTANYDNYLTQLTQPQNASGRPVLCPCKP